MLYSTLLQPSCVTPQLIRTSETDNNVIVCLQAMENLKADNQRLKEENGALIRVISKLSK